MKSAAYTSLADAIEAAAEQTAAKTPPVRVSAPEPPPGLNPQARRLWYVEREIRACSDAIAQAHAKGDAARTGSLQEQLRKF